MGAVNAFARGIITITKNPRLLLIPLIISLLLSPLSAYLLKEMPVFQEFSEESLSLENESIIFEEYGRGLSEEAINEMVEFLKFLMIFMLISLLLQALSEYAVIRGALMAENNQKYTLVDLLYEGVYHAFQVFLVNLVVAIVSAGVLLVPVFFFGILMTLTEASAFVVLLLVVEIPLALLLMSASSMAVPIYVTTNSIGASLSCFSIAFKNKLSSIGFAALLLVSIFLLLAIPASFIGLLFLGRTDFMANLVSNILQAPFQAIVQALIAICGLMLYLELIAKRKSFEEEITEEFGI
ncbi:hypothetical protein DRN41_07160 [Thermococci archaeon]|nr:MAG: hypothetical protein DRN41_07160 [Thermococci archaeon]